MAELVIPEHWEDKEAFKIENHVKLWPNVVLHSGEAATYLNTLGFEGYD